MGQLNSTANQLSASRPMRTILVLFFVFVLAYGQASQKDACEPFLHTQACLDKPVEQRDPCITEFNQKYLQCKYVTYGEGKGPINVTPPKPTTPANTFCAVNSGFKPNSCFCRFKQICTKNLCYCYQTFESCAKSTPFKRKSVCLCGDGTKRKCFGSKCKCAVSAYKSVKAPKVSVDTWKKLPTCSFSKTYKKESCTCSRFQRCDKGVCKCHKILVGCPAKGSFNKSVLCNCKSRGAVRACKGTTCSCKKVKPCNLFKSYTSATSCFCKQDFRFLTCQTNKGKKDCRCEHLSTQCKMNKSVKRGTCFCNPKLNSFKCTRSTIGTFCTCEKKPFCELDTKVLRNTCRCQVRPTDDLQDENSEKKRVFRKYGWKKCSNSDKKVKGAPRICQCKALKCYEAGRFKKYFCKCPRLTKQYCNKKTGYCKCLSKKSIKKFFKGTYRFRGMIKTSSLVLASFKYEKRKIKIYTSEKKGKKESRYIFVDHENGSFYVVMKPSIKNDVDLRAEMSFYDPADQNAKSIQKQIKKPLKKYSK
jgi:hypothetical protein